MPSKTRSRRKPVPRILETPIEVSSWFEDQRTTARQVKQRMQAVYAYYGVDRETPQHANQLLELMARERFPRAFKQRRKGYPTTKKPKWTSAAKEHLLQFFRDNQATGKTQEDIARLYIKQFCSERSSPKGLVAEFRRAEKWEMAGSPLTAEEMDIEVERYLELQSEIRRGK